MSHGHPDPGRLFREIAPLLQAGELQPPRVARVLDLAEAAEAHRLLESGGAGRGRIVLEDAAAH